MTKMQIQSFSLSSKLELSKIENRNTCCKKAEIYSLLYFSKYFINGGQTPIENRLMLNRLSNEIALHGMFIANIEKTRGKTSLFSLVGDDTFRQAMVYFNQTENEINYINIENTCCFKAFLRGLFLACGNISDPKKQYKLELAFNKDNYCEGLAEYIEKISGIDFKTVFKKDHFILYVKSSEHLENFLAFTGATNASMQIMQERMYKEELGNINRIANFETANLDKTYSASVKQTVAIADLFDRGVLNTLPADLQEIGYIRLQNPTLSLAKIAQKMGISRSAANHKFNKLIKLSETLK